MGKLETRVFLDDIVISLREVRGRELRRPSESRLWQRLCSFWGTSGPLLFRFLCVQILLQLSRILWGAARNPAWVLDQIWDVLLREVAGFMPRGPLLTHLEQEVEVLRNRVNQLGSLWRESVGRSHSQRVAEPAVGLPAVRSDQLSLVLAFLVGLWSGCVVSLLALCVGVYIGHSL